MVGLDVQFGQVGEVGGQLDEGAVGGEVEVVDRAHRGVDRDPLHRAVPDGHVGQNLPQRHPLLGGQGLIAGGVKVVVEKQHVVLLRKDRDVEGPEIVHQVLVLGGDPLQPQVQLLQKGAAALLVGVAAGHRPDDAGQRQQDGHHPFQPELGGEAPVQAVVQFHGLIPPSPGGSGRGRRPCSRGSSGQSSWWRQSPPGWPRP